MQKKIPMRKANLSSFEGLVTYLAGSQGVANRVGKVEIHNYESSDLRWAVQETLAVQDQNKRSAADKTYHLMVSLAGGEFLTDEQLSRIEQSMIEALGYAEHQRISVVHRDTDNLHFHVAINKVHPEKKDHPRAV
ncbi:relaxase/mobilization nuclease domain-containing protein [Neisseria gonorrhoeae]